MARGWPGWRGGQEATAGAGARGGPAEGEGRRGRSERGGGCSTRSSRSGGCTAESCRGLNFAPPRCAKEPSQRALPVCALLLPSALRPRGAAGGEGGGREKSRTKSGREAGEEAPPGGAPWGRQAPAGESLPRGAGLALLAAPDRSAPQLGTTYLYIFLPADPPTPLPLSPPGRRRRPCGIPPTPTRGGNLERPFLRCVDLGKRVWRNQTHTLDWGREGWIPPDFSRSLR